ncbi:hypothetical protein ACNOYE_08260 [Nannocystaceae bacterium ST9]
MTVLFLRPPYSRATTQKYKRRAMKSNQEPKYKCPDFSNGSIPDKFKEGLIYTSPTFLTATEATTATPPSPPMTWERGAAFVPASWVPKTGKEETFEILIESSAFFGPGYDYCMYIFEQATQAAIKQEIWKLIQAFILATSTHAEEEAEIAKAELPNDAAKEAAKDKVRKNSSAIASEFQTLIDSIMRHGIAMELVGQVIDVNSRLSQFQDLQKAEPQTWFTSGTHFVATEIKNADLFNFVLNRLSWDQGAGIDRNAGGYVVSGSSTKVIEIESEIQNGAWISKLNGSFRSLNFTSSIVDSAITTEDILLLRAGRVRLNSSKPPTTFEEELANVEKVLDNALRGQSLPSERQRADAFKAKLELLDNLLRDAKDSNSHVMQLVKLWAANDSELDVQDVLGCESSLAGVRPRAWRDGCQGPGPVYIILIRTTGALDAADLALMIHSATVRTVFTTTTTVTQATAEIPLSQQAFLTQHVMPTLGFAPIVADHRMLTVQGYAGVQIFAYPNPHDEPMWTNGLRDFGRLVGFEFAFGLSKDQFQNSPEYSGLAGRVPPFFMGLAIHAIPYFPFSVGAVLLGQRPYGFEGERYKVAVGFYFGLSVELNAFDFLRKKFSTAEAAK